MKKIKLFLEKTDKILKKSISKIDRKTLIFVMLITFIFGFAAHGFAFMNDFYSHDSLEWFNQGTEEIEIKNSSGRIFQEPIINLRGSVTVPLLLGILSLFWMGLSAYLIIKTFKIKNKICMSLLTMLLVSNISYTLINATYMHETDIYNLALLLSVIPVYLYVINKKLAYIIGPLCIMIMCGIYQSYLTVTLLLFILLIIKNILEKTKFKDNILCGLTCIGISLVGLILYQIALNISVQFFGVVLSTDYNDLGTIYNFLNVNLFTNLYDTYYYFAKNVIYPYTYMENIFLVGLTLIVLVFSFIILLQVIKKRKIEKKNIILLFILILLTPLACNFLYFMTAGHTHKLMITSFILIYTLIFVLFSYRKSTYILSMKNVCYVIIGLIIFNASVYSNTMYLEKELNMQSTLANMNRVIYDLEQLEDYKLGKTKLVFIGSTKEKKLGDDRPGFDKIKGTGSTGSTSVLKGANYESYFEHILNYPINDNTTEEIYEKYKNEIKEMSSFPDKGYIKKIDGKYFIKFSKPEEL